MADTFVILDLEWNGTYSRRIKGFINEIIEFGAVKVNESLEILDTFEALVRPQVGKKISGKIRTLTSITNEELEGGLQFMQVSSRFRKWMGGAVLLTWGTSDILTLIENCRYFCGSQRIPFLDTYVDLQAYCQHQYTLLQIFEKDPDQREAYGRQIQAWIADLQQLLELL